MSIPVYKNERKNPMSNMTSGAEPRWTYTSPKEKPQHGKPPELGYDINAYNLPAIDVQTERRNFPGYGEATYFSLDDMQRGDLWGTTDTDSTNPNQLRGPRGESGYSRINQKSGSKGRSWKSTSQRS